MKLKQGHPSTRKTKDSAAKYASRQEVIVFASWERRTSGVRCIEKDAAFGWIQPAKDSPVACAPHNLLDGEVIASQQGFICIHTTRAL